MARVVRTDAAACVVTDFSRERSWTVSQDCRINAALREMECAGVHSLLVVDGSLVIGLVTSSDIAARRSLELRAPRNRAPAFEQIAVRRIMRPWHCLPTLDWRLVCAARVGHIENYFRNTRLTHVLLVEQVAHAGPFVRGLISRNRLELALGQAL